MTFSATAPAGALAKAFAMAARVSPKPGNGVASILANVRLTGRDGRLYISGTNMDAKIEIGVECKAKGEVTAPADKLAAIAARMDADKPLSLQQSDTQLIVTQGRSRFTLPTLPAEDFALKMTPHPDTAFDVDAASLTTALKSIEGAVETDSVRIFIYGALLDLKGGSARLVGTDGHKLGVSPLCEEGAVGVEVIIPPASFSVLHVLAGLAPTLTLATTQSMLSVTAGSVRYETKVIDASYPAWRRLVPPAADIKTRVKVAGDVFRRAMEKMAALGPSSLTFSFGDQIEIEASSADERMGRGGGADDVIEHVGREGPPVRIKVTSDGVVWALGSLAGASVIEIGIKGPLDAVLLSDPERPDDVRMIMPLRG